MDYEEQKMRGESKVGHFEDMVPVLRPSLFFRCASRCYDFTRLNILSLTNITLSVSTIVLLLYMGNEANRTLSDASEVLTDVRIIVPEIRSSLDILRAICTQPPYRDYCGLV